MTAKQGTRINRLRWRWIDLLDDIVESINSTKSRVMGMSSKDVTSKNSHIVYSRKYPPLQPDTVKFNKGDIVRVQTVFNIYSTGYRPTFKKFLYRVVRIIPTVPVTFELATVDETGQTISKLSKHYYSQQLTLVTKPNFKTLVPDPPLLRRKYIN